MTLQQILPVAIPLLVVVLILKRKSRPRTLRPHLMWVVPTLVVLGIGTGLWFMPHAPFDWTAWLAFALALALGGVAGWWRGKTVAIARRPDGSLEAKASPLGLILILGLLAVRALLRDQLAVHAADWRLDPVAVTEAFMLFAVGLVVMQRVEMAIRARRIRKDEETPATHAEAAA